MNPVAKLLIITGAILIVAGLFWQFGGAKLPLGRLPGDIAVEKQNFKFYFPISTSILISILLTAILFIIGLFSRK